MIKNIIPHYIIIMNKIFTLRYYALEEYSEEFKYFKENLNIFINLEKGQKIGKMEKNVNEKKNEIEKSEKNNENTESLEEKNSETDTGEPKENTENENLEKEYLSDDDNRVQIKEKIEENTGRDKNMDDTDTDENSDNNVNVEPNKKEYVYCIYEPGFTQKISRWWWSENREKTFEYLDNDFNMFVRYLNKIKSDVTSINYMYYSGLINNISEFINKIIPGLYNLKITYSDDEKMKAKMDSIIMILIDFKAEMSVVKKRKLRFTFPKKR